VVYVELRFPIIGATLPRDHSRAMFRAISRLIPEALSADWLLIKDVQGIRRPDISFQFPEQACLNMRLPQSRVSLMLKLSDKRIELGKHLVRFGTPEISLLKPCSSLYAECVTINGCVTTDAFLDSLAWRLDEIGVEGDIELGVRRRFRAGCRMITGFALTLHGLSEDGSIALQEQGLGSHRHLGCGFFVPVRNKVNRLAGEIRLYRE
jgi:CRISPR-associated protein Cas6